MIVREVDVSDAAMIQAIYAPVVANTIISFEEIPPDISEMARRIATIAPVYPYLVAEEDGQVLGYAYACEHRTRSAYRFSVDVTVYVADRAHRRGIGRLLYSELLPAAAARGYHAAFAGIALPNEASVRLHQTMGFRSVGIYREVGRKFGRWHDVGWWQRLL
ncbi:GNAT family N-acetyltransferase (plasmid) [Rhizobium sp. CC1099]|uniref:arsinothricin resistance N-acetyltransferase ArsN1 family B n=1 Tax=Rhizobium sp. CC1099 TaxID=3039160 RepID=UPI0024B1D916|nr:arsinothricin resistance N-acetyltransferase ArsN1 family B [Rhizobium sp. CC1099]WFU92179.1 GNAT family N-acetyltransferase [Rhizobium sp. CC1099]